MSFSVLSILKKLESKGFTKCQAEGIAEAVLEVVEGDKNDLATKDDLKSIQLELRTEITAVKSELKTEIGKVREEMSERDARMIKWMVRLHLGTAFAMLSFFGGLIYFIFKVFVPHL